MRPARLQLLLIAAAFLAGTSFGQTGLPRVVRYVAPHYPPAAKAMRVEALVNVRVAVGKDGAVVSANAQNGHPIFRKTAEAAATKWIFTVSTKAHQITLTFSFRIDRKNKRPRIRFRKPYTLEIIGQTRAIAP